VRVVARDTVRRAVATRGDVREIEDATEVHVECIVAGTGEDPTATFHVADERRRERVVVNARRGLVDNSVCARTDVRRCDGYVTRDDLVTAVFNLHDLVRLLRRWGRNLREELNAVEQLFVVGDLVIGWVFVACAAMVAVAMIGRAFLGHSNGWYEWLAVLALSGLFLVIGVANLLPDSPRLLMVVAVAWSALFFLVLGVASLVAPDAMTVDAGRGPRTGGAARTVGAVLVIAGSVMLVGAARLRRRRDRFSPGS